VRAGPTGPAKDRQEKTMMNHDLASHLARAQQRQVLAEAGQRHQTHSPAPGTSRPAARAIRSLATVITHGIPFRLGRV
jgi:hypothetical protein